MLNNSNKVCLGTHLDRPHVKRSRIEQLKSNDLTPLKPILSSINYRNFLKLTPILFVTGFVIGCKYFVELAIPATARPNARAFDATSFCRSDQSPKLLHVCIPRCAIINLSLLPQQCYQQLSLIDVVLNQFFVRTPSTRPPVNRSRPIARGGCGVCKAAAERGVCKAAPATPPVGGTGDAPKSSSIDAAALSCDRRPFCAS